MSISIADLADGIWRNQLNETSLTTTPEIAYWIRSQGLGVLNSLIFTSFTINEDTLEIEQDNFGIDEQAILGLIYLIKFYALQANNFLGAAGVSDTIEWSEKGHTIRKLNRTEQAKTFLTLKSQVKNELDDIVGSYKINRATPKTISGIEILQQTNYNHGFNRVLDE